MGRKVRIAGASIGVGVLCVIVAVGMFFIAVLGVYADNWFAHLTSDTKGDTEKLSLVEAQGEFRIAAYDHFFNLCTSIQEKEATIRGQKQELETNPSPARVEQINANLGVLQAQRDSLINQYNNDGAKDYTIGQYGPKELFGGTTLPYPLSLQAEETTCAV